VRGHGLPAITAVLGVALLAGCGKTAAPSVVMGDAGTGDGGDGSTTKGDGSKGPVACNGRCSGGCTGVCTGICSQRTGDGQCTGVCEEICVGTCDGVCTRSTRGDGGGDAGRDAANDRRSDAVVPIDAPDPPADPTAGSWANRSNTTTLSWPPVGHAGALAYDSDRQKVVMFGGASAPGNATWEWDGQTGRWELRQQMGGTRPSPRWGHAMAYDALRFRTIMYGGIDDTGGSNSEVWEWDGDAGTWTRRGPGPTPSRWGHAMVYDASTGHIVLFAGSYRHPTLGDGDLYDTWDYDADADVWVNKTYPLPPSWPRARRGHAMVYDAARAVSVMYGGEVLTVAGATSDLWEWDNTGNVWIDRTPNLSTTTVWPGPRAWHGLAFDGSVILLFGGTPNNLWEWNSDTATWRTLTPPRGAPWPPARARSPLVFDEGRRTIVLTGATMMVGASALADLWEWSRD
jgi:hypothetical protein